jgi:hypothetical protein
MHAIKFGGYFYAVYIYQKVLFCATMAEVFILHDSDYSAITLLTIFVYSKKE